MATVSVVENNVVLVAQPRDAKIWQWTLTTANADGEPVAWPAAADRSVHMIGTWGSGGTIVMQGSNLPAATAPDDTAANWFGLLDPFENAVSFTADGGKQITENTHWIRPKLTAGTGVTVAVYLLTVAPRRLL